MSAILCPFLLAVPSRHLVSGGATMTPDYGDDRNANPRACVGSPCAKWVPEVVNPHGSMVHDGAHGWVETGAGWCSENLRRTPFADPAAPPKPDPMTTLDEYAARVGGSVEYACHGGEHGVALHYNLTGEPETARASGSTRAEAAERLLAHLSVTVRASS